MEIQIRFTGPFNGIVSSKGTFPNKSIVVKLKFANETFHYHQQFNIGFYRSCQWSELYLCSTTVGEVILFISNTVCTMWYKARFTWTILWKYGMYWKLQWVCACLSVICVVNLNFLLLEMKIFHDRFVVLFFMWNFANNFITQFFKLMGKLWPKLTNQCLITLFHTLFN